MSERGDSGGGGTRRGVRSMSGCPAHVPTVNHLATVEAHGERIYSTWPLCRARVARRLEGYHCMNPQTPCQRGHRLLRIDSGMLRRGEVILGVKKS